MTEDGSAMTQKEVSDAIGRRLERHLRLLGDEREPPERLMTPAEVVEFLSDCNAHDHYFADLALLAVVPPEVAAAYRRCVNRASWWWE